MRVISKIKQIQGQSARWLKLGVPVGLVPTMGCLHEGHLSLIKHARRAVGSQGVVVVSVYVNPTQFGPKEDFSKYPRDLKRDLALCRRAGVDVVFAPSDTAMYPGREQGRFSTHVLEESLSEVMEGRARPTHFRGVATVVTKLFNIVRPTVAVFGAKDWQQAAILKRMVSDLNFPVEMFVAPTIRERDGLALSSRNRYLTPSQRQQATVLWRSIEQARKRIRSRGMSAAKLSSETQQMVATEPEAKLDYVAFFDGETLAPVKTVRHGSHMALAVFFGKTRLIDNGRL